jgi:hypothetical protein
MYCLFVHNSVVLTPAVIKRWMRRLLGFSIVDLESVNYFEEITERIIADPSSDSPVRDIILMSDTLHFCAVRADCIQFNILCIFFIIFISYRTI